METKIQRISTLILTQLLTQKQCLWKQLNPDCEELNGKNKIEKKNVVDNTVNQKNIYVTPSSSTTENTTQCNNTQNIEKKRNTQNETKSD